MVTVATCPPNFGYSYICIQHSYSSYHCYPHSFQPSVVSRQMDSIVVTWSQIRFHIPSQWLWKLSSLSQCVITNKFDVVWLLWLCCCLRSVNSSSSPPAGWALLLLLWPLIIVTALHNVTSRHHNIHTLVYSLAITIILASRSSTSYRRIVITSRCRCFIYTTAVKHHLSFKPLPLHNT